MEDINKHGLPRDIPTYIKRQVRQRCGYGCVVCGKLFCQYHHFNPTFNEATAHVADGITLLCPFHHDQITNGRVSEDFISRHNANPYSVKNSNSKYLFEDLSYPLEVALGGLVFISPEGCLLRVDDNEVFSINNPPKENKPLITASFFSSSGNTLKVVENEIIASTGSWDIETQGREIVIRDAPRDVFLHLKFTPPKRIEVIRLKNFVNGNILDLKFGGKLYVETASGAKIDFAKGFIAIGGSVSLSSQKGITIDGGSLVVGVQKGLPFNMDLDHILSEVYKLAELNKNSL